MTYVPMMGAVRQGAGTITTTLRVRSSNWHTGAAAIEQGLIGSRHKSWYLTCGPDHYLWHTHNDGSTSPGVEAGIDPGTYVDGLAGMTGHAVALPAGYVTAAARAALIAIALEGLTGVVSATVAGVDNADGSRSIVIRHTLGTIAVGARTWAQRGLAGLFGSHAFRRALAGEITGATDTPITRNLAQRFASHPPADAQIYAVSFMLGATVSTTAANIPRLFLRGGSASTTVPGATIFDFGQIPASQIVGGRRAVIFLSATQAAALRTYLDSVAGTVLWACVKATATTQNTTLPSGGIWEGEFSDLPLRIDTTSTPASYIAGNQAPPATWTDSATTAVAVLGFALHYFVDPAGNGESYPIVGSLRTLSDARTTGAEVTLPNTVTRQTIQRPSGIRGAQLHSVTAELTDTGPRYAVKVGGDVTTDPDDPNLTGATTLYDFGQVASTGTVEMLAPTGDSSVHITSEIATIEFKGNGLRGWGWTTMPGNNNPLQANDFVYANGAVGSADGTNQHELDYAGENGDPTTAFLTPIAGVYTQPNNLPALRMTLRCPPDVVE